MSSGKALLVASAMRKLNEKKRREILKEAFRKMKEENTPLPGNICHGCGGHVVKKVSSFFRGMIHYSLPKCELCGLVYLYAENAPCVGGEEFIRKLREPMCAHN